MYCWEQKVISSEEFFVDIFGFPPTPATNAVDSNIISNIISCLDNSIAWILFVSFAAFDA